VGYAPCGRGFGQTGGVADLETTTDEQRLAVERWFLSRGLPHLIAGYNAREDIFTRAAPLLSVVFVGEILVGLNAEFEWWGNVLSLLGATAIALAGIAVVNRVRGRRPFQRPDTIGVPELVGFVLVPPLIPLVTADQPRQAVVVVVSNLVLLGVVYLGTSYAVLPTVRWGLVQAFRQLTTVVNLMVRSLPLLLLFTMVIFLNAEVWKIMDDLPNLLWWSTLALLVVVGSAFVLLRIPRELAGVSTLDSWDVVRDDVLDTPAAHVDLGGLTEPPDPPPLRRRERLNVAFVFFASQAIQIALVAILIGVFYVAFGLLTIIDTTIVQWTGSEQLDVIVSWWVGDTQLILTRELLRTATFVAAIAGLQFTVSALTDSSYREEFLTGTLGELREAIAVRAAYRRVLVPDGE